MAPDMAFAPLIKRSDPRSGDLTVRAKNLSRAEPDPALFLVPADYTIVDEDGPFRLMFAFPKQN